MKNSNQSHPVRVYAHRGASMHYPENTILSFLHAIQAGVTHLETDVHQTRDHVIVVAHDQTGERMAGVQKYIKDQDLAEIKTWDAGFGFKDVSGNFPFRGQGLVVSTLDEVFAEFPRTKFNIDVKQHDEATVHGVMEVVLAHKAENRVILSSFEPRIIKLFIRLGFAGFTGISRSAIALLLAVPQFLLPGSMIKGHAIQIPRKWKKYHFDNEMFIRKAHHYELRVDFWVINEPDEAVRLLALGADGIMTDDPARILPVVQEFAYSNQRHFESN